MSASIFVGVLVAIAICTIHLFLGVWIGAKLAASKELAALPQIDLVTAQLRERLADVVSLANQARVLSDDCSRTEPKLPPHITIHAESVAQESALWQKSMESMAHQVLPELAPAEALQTIESAASSEPPGPEIDAPSAARFRYEVWQHVAPMLGGELPAPDQFEAVHCRDLSRKGFSYFSDDHPDAPMLVAALGNPPSLRFFVAKVTRSPIASRDGKVGYQIECEFVSKLAEAYEWDANLGFVFSSSRAMNAYDTDELRQPA
jgi:hypothetical protein